MRICVDQNGDRVYGFETNTLTVMANQSYEDFAKQLQTEIETDENFKFGMIEPISFAALRIQQNGDDKITYMSLQESHTLFDFFREQKTQYYLNLC